LQWFLDLLSSFCDAHLVSVDEEGMKGENKDGIKKRKIQNKEENGMRIMKPLEEKLENMNYLTIGNKLKTEMKILNPIVWYGMSARCSKSSRWGCGFC
jgi:hypothetical protein